MLREESCQLLYSSAMMNSPSLQHLGLIAQEALQVGLLDTLSLKGGR